MSDSWRSRLRPFPTLRGYRRAWLGRDLLAGVTFGAVTIPGQLATAHLADLPPVTGLYGFLAACLLAAAWAANRQLAMGVDSTVAPILATGLAGLVLVGDAGAYQSLAVVATFCVGVMILVVGLANWSWFGDLLAKPVVIGFLGGIAIIIVVDQIPGLLGMPAEGGRTVARIGDAAAHLGDIQLATAAIGVTSLVLLLVSSRLSRRFPGALVVLVGATAAVAMFGLSDRGIAVLGPIPSGLPSLALPPLSLEAVEAVLGTAVAITFICLAQTSATSRSAAAIGGFETDVSADFRALGGANILSSLFGAFTVDASPPSTQIVAQSRGRTQLVSLVGAVMVVAVLFVSWLAEDLPTATLSAVLIYIAARIFHLDQMRATYRYSWRAFALMLVTLFGVVLLGIVYGVALALLISFAERARRTARPELVRIGRLANGHWVPVLDERTESFDDILAYQLNGPLWFGNAEWFRQRMFHKLAGDRPPRVLVLDATRMDDIDYTGADALLEVAKVCTLRGVRFGIAAHAGRTLSEFDRSGLVDELGADRFYDTTEEAVQALSSEAKTQRQG